MTFGLRTPADEDVLLCVNSYLSKVCLKITQVLPITAKCLLSSQTYMDILVS